MGEVRWPAVLRSSQNLGDDTEEKGKRGRSTPLGPVTPLKGDTGDLLDLQASHVRARVVGQDILRLVVH